MINYAITFKSEEKKKKSQNKKSKKIFIQEKFFDFEIFFSSLKNNYLLIESFSVKCDKNKD
ncbi:hypothetical protein BpHYR1_002180 [Brachionus plicatilis]|uniref:Uncharacterized protein n=1 Tax=Brachionus plicatilis TaxID=10195 RepID=A0A3M7Q985_BRAPC|nr:hypothetical protein BpHYR1_002180 [Brachionus plicatilis]